MSEFSQISNEERHTLEKILNRDYPVSEIARTLERPRSTIYRELDRNTEHGKEYEAHTAQQKADQRKTDKPKATRFTEKMKEHARDKLEDYWTPELISKRAQKEGWDFVSHETIYLWIYAEAQRGESKGIKDRDSQLYQYLPSSRRKRRNRNRANDERGKIPNRIPIEKRPQAANDRSTLGHMEGDLIIGKNHRGALLVLTDRKYRFTFIRRLNNKSSELIKKKIVRIVQTNPWIKTITVDNDMSFAKHKEYEATTFFTRPYKSQDKGTVENKNKVIRQKYPKKTDFTKVSAVQIRKLQKWLNNRPMKLFEYKTPKEYLESKLFKCNVALVA